MVVRAKVAAIEFDGDDVRLAVVKTGGRAPKVLELRERRAVYSAPEQRVDALVEAVKSIFTDLKTRPSAVVLCISSANSMVRMLTIPFRGVRKVASAVRFELEPYLAIPIEELAVDFSPVLEADGQTDVLAVGVRRALLEEQAGILQAAGVEADGADVDVLGMTGLWRGTQPRVKGLQAVLHIREKSSVLAVIFNKTLAYFRHLTFGAEGMRTNPSAAARDVQNSLRAFHGSWRVEGEVASLSVTGDFMDAGSAEAISAWESFESHFEIPVSRINLLESLKAADLVRSVRRVDVSLPESLPEPGAAASEIEGQSESKSFAESDDEASASVNESGDAIAEREAVRLAVAVSDARPRLGNVWEAVIGAAQGAAGNGFSMNLLEGDLAPKNVFRGMATNVMATSCLAVLLLAGIAWYYYYARARNLAECDSMRAQVEELNNQVATLKEQGINLPGETFADPSLLEILREIASKMPDSKVVLTELKMERGVAVSDSSGKKDSGPPPWLTIRGEVKDDNLFGQAMSDMQSSEIFQVGEPDRKLDGEKSTFKIVVRRKSKSNES
jgi:hypothetical protein